MIRAFFSRQFIIFLVTGGIAAAANFLSRIFFNQWLSFSASIIIAYLIGMTIAFILAKIFVFKQSQQSLHKSAAFFVLVNGVAVLQTWGISLALAYSILPALGVEYHTKEIAHAAGVIFPVFTSFIGHKYLSFQS